MKYRISAVVDKIIYYLIILNELINSFILIKQEFPDCLIFAGEIKKSGIFASEIVFYF